MRAFDTHRECINVSNIKVHAEISNEDRDLNFEGPPSVRMLLIFEQRLCRIT